MTVSFVPKGLAFTRLAKALVIGGDTLAAKAFCEGQGPRWADTPSVMLALKAATDALGTAEVSALVQVRPLAREFLQLVRPNSVLDRISGFRTFPTNVSVLKVNGGPTVSWVREGHPIPMSEFSLERETLEFHKVAALIALTSELLMHSSTAGEMAIAHEMARAVGRFTDNAFLDPAASPVADESPGSITHGVTPISSSGSSISAVQSDLRDLFANFVANDGALESAVLVMAPRTALALSLLTGTSGAPLFPKLGVRGGEISGIPVLTSAACLADGSVQEAFAVLLDPAQIMLSDEGDVSIETARHATVQMLDNPAAGATTGVSLWQRGLVAMKLIRSITWTRTDTTGVAVLNNIVF